MVKKNRVGLNPRLQLIISFTRLFFFTSFLKDSYEKRI
jgi:hypothetical protein